MQRAKLSRSAIKLCSHLSGRPWGSCLYQFSCNRSSFPSWPCSTTQPLAQHLLGPPAAQHAMIIQRWLANILSSALLAERPLMGSLQQRQGIKSTSPMCSPRLQKKRGHQVSPAAGPSWLGLPGPASPNKVYSASPAQLKTVDKLREASFCTTQEDQECLNSNDHSFLVPNEEAG